MEYYGQLDFTALCRLWKQHKELFKTVDFKDGPHALLNVNINERQQPDEHGNTHYIKASCKSAEQREGVNYYVSSGLKPREQTQQPQGEQQDPLNNANTMDDLPY